MLQIDNVINFYVIQISTNAPPIHNVMPMLHVTTQKDPTFVNVILDSVVMVLPVMVRLCLLNFKDDELCLLRKLQNF